jgi:hypothetical protein
VVTDELCYESRRIQERMEAIETTQRREPDIGDVSESEDMGSDEETKGAPGGETT